MAEQKIEQGKIKVRISGGIGSLSFYHPKGNSLPGDLLRQLAQEITELGRNDEVKVVALYSEREDGPFCAGASFDELLSIESFNQAKEFFMGFAEVILAMKNCPKFVITRVQGKAVGGGVGVVAASDYALASSSASIKLSEFALGFGPFVIGPAVERRIGKAAFTAAAIDTDWREANWAREKGLYSEVFDSFPVLDGAFATLAGRLAESSLDAIRDLKRIFWQGSEDWDRLLPERAELSARLVLTDFTRQKIEAFKNR
ncbi:MAG TPA: enoyl-CoA hydratase/isomerase family protein [Acidobacteriota bacterium]|nr:enoyl-CoA hydratase/isomerase family protein [Acidobacteriota bacterium]